MLHYVLASTGKVLFINRVLPATNVTFLFRCS